MSTQNLLAGALAVQVALAALTWWPRGAADVAPRALVEGGANGITALEVAGSGDDATSVKLVSKDGRWLVESAHGYPADAEKVGEVLDALGKVQLRAPVATSATSHEPLGVADGAAEKRITFTTGDGKATTVLIGAAASRASHVREAGRDEVYVVKGLSAWTLKDTAKGYLPTNHLELEKEDLAALSIANARGVVSLVRRDGAWMPQDGPGAADAAKVGKLLDDLARVRLHDVVGTTVLPEHGLTDGAVRVTWTLTEGDRTLTRGLVIGAEQGGNHHLKLDDDAFVVLAPGYRLKSIVEADPAELILPLTAEAGEE